MTRLRAGAIALLLGACSKKAPPPAPSPAPPPTAEARFADRSRTPEERLGALRELRARDAASRHDAYPRVLEALRSEAARLDGFSVDAGEEMAALAALEWLAEERDDLVPTKLELHLDRVLARRRRLPDASRASLALLLAHYPARASAGETLWRTFKDREEADLVRSSCLKALQAFHPNDLEELVLQIAPAPGDRWLRDLQGRLR